jgi:hypothetical protein
MIGSAKASDRDHDEMQKRPHGDPKDTVANLIVDDISRWFER